MPNWKKVITSGSDAALTSVIATAGFTGSLLGTASFASTASFITASGVYGPYGSNSVISASFALTASSALNAQDILIRVLNQSGNSISKGIVVRITGSNNSSDIPRIVTASYENDNNSANTLGIANETIANGAEGFVMTEGVIKGINTSAFVSGQLIYLGPTGSIIGTAPVAPLHSVRLGEVIREQLNNGSIYVRIDNGYELGELHDVRDTTTTSSYGDLLVKSGSIWINSKQLTGSYGLTGSLTATSFTGSLQGTASWANNATTASYALQALSASFASTASFVNPLIQNVSITGILGVTGSTNISTSLTSSTALISGSGTNRLTVVGSGSAQPVFTVQGSQGELFSVTDSLSGSLFSVNDISGLPILEVFSDNTTLIGNYLDPMLITTAKVTQTNSGSFVVYSLPTASYDTAFFEYSLKSGSNARAGTIMAIQSGSSVNFTETTTTDLGNTTSVSFTVVVTGSNMALTGSSTTGSWTIKTIIRSI